MSNQVLQKYLFKAEQVEQKNDFACSDVAMVNVPDSNLFNYSTGWVNFNNTSLQGNDTKRVLEMSQAVVTVPFGCVLQVQASQSSKLASFGTQSNAGGVITYYHSLQNIFAVAPKAYHHIFNQVSNKFGGKVINQSNEYFNYYLNEKLKTMNTDQYDILGDMLDLSMDSANSYQYSSSLLEVNNNTQETYDLSKGNDPSKWVNKGHIERMRKLNIDWLSTESNFSNTKLFNDSVVQDTYATGLIAVCNSAGAVIDVNSSSLLPISYLVFQYVATIPLMFLSEFYEKIQSIVTLSQFELRLQTNLASNNSWSIQCGNKVSDVSTDLPVESIVSNASVGQSCPFMISKPSSDDGTTGLTIYCSDKDAKPKITLRPFIGYYGNQVNNLSISTSTGLPSTQAGMYPCQIWIPSVSYNGSYQSTVIRMSPQKLLYNDFIVDTTHTDVPGGSQVQKLLTYQTGRLRKLYILPYLSSSGISTACDPRQSLISSAPNTCSLCRLINLNVQLGSVNVFSSPISYQFNHYYNSALIAQGFANGNAFKADTMSGRVKFSDFNSCYGAYVIDLERVSDDVSDDIIKNIQLTYKIDTKSTVKYNMLYIIEYQSECNVDRITGQVVNSSDA